MLKIIVRPDGTGTIIEDEEDEEDGDIHTETQNAR